jgi:hypothetical protein
MRLFTLKLLLLSVVAGALMLAGATGVFADTGAQNPDFIVSADLAPDDAAAGDEITATASIENTTGRWQAMRVCRYRHVEGRDPYIDCDLSMIGPNRVRTLSMTFTMPRAEPGTTITIGVSAANANGRSHASDSLTLS